MWGKRATAKNGSLQNELSGAHGAMLQYVVERVNGDCSKFVFPKTMGFNTKVI